MTTIKLKHTDVPGRVPQLGDLVRGEIAANILDGKFYFRKAVDSNPANDFVALLSTEGGGDDGGGSWESDVSVTNPTNNQSLIYNSLTGKWENKFVVASSIQGFDQRASEAAELVITNAIGSTVQGFSPKLEDLVQLDTLGVVYLDDAGYHTKALEGSTRIQIVEESGKVTVDLLPSGVTSGVYAGLSIDTFGRVIAASSLTTLEGYGIQDAINVKGGLVEGKLTYAEAFDFGEFDLVDRRYVDLLAGGISLTAGLGIDIANQVISVRAGPTLDLAEELNIKAGPEGSVMTTSAGSVVWEEILRGGVF